MTANDLTANLDGYAKMFTSKAAIAVFLHELDSDGDLDVLIAGQRRAEIWWNDGAGNFTPSGRRFEYSRQRVAIGDFNQDVEPDLSAAAETGYQVWYSAQP